MNAMPDQTVSHHGSSARARLALTALWGALCLLILAAPLAAAFSTAPVSSFIRLLFSPVCHQLPERSFALLGHPWAVCHRCAGIYLGLLAASLFSPVTRMASLGPAPRRALVAAATLPLLADFLLTLADIWAGTPASRFTTGFLFGFLLSTLLVAGVAELLQENLMRPRVWTTMNHGGQT